MIIFIDLESIQHKLLSDYSLNIRFLGLFPYIDGPSFSRTNPYKISIFERLVTCTVFRNCSHILTRTQGKGLSICFSSKQQVREPP